MSAARTAAARGTTRGLAEQTPDTEIHHKDPERLQQRIGASGHGLRNRNGKRSVRRDTAVRCSRRARPPLTIVAASRQYECRMQPPALCGWRPHQMIRRCAGSREPPCNENSCSGCCLLLRRPVAGITTRRDRRRRRPLRGHAATAPHHAAARGGCAGRQPRAADSGPAAAGAGCERCAAARRPAGHRRQRAGGAAAPPGSGAAHRRECRCPAECAAGNEMRPLRVPRGSSSRSDPMTALRSARATPNATQATCACSARWICRSSQRCTGTHYPLFQQAYQDLGNPDGHFNDRLIEVIDHLLATPVADGPSCWARPKVMYEFADPRLQALSVGQKALLRLEAPHSGARCSPSYAPCALPWPLPRPRNQQAASRRTPRRPGGQSRDAPPQPCHLHRPPRRRAAGVVQRRLRQPGERPPGTQRPRRTLGPGRRGQRRLRCRGGVHAGAAPEEDARAAAPQDFGAHGGEIAASGPQDAPRLSARADDRCRIACAHASRKRCDHRRRCRSSSLPVR